MKEIKPEKELEVVEVKKDKRSIEGDLLEMQYLLREKRKIARQCKIRERNTRIAMVVTVITAAFMVGVITGAFAMYLSIWVF